MPALSEMIANAKDAKSAPAATPAAVPIPKAQIDPTGTYVLVAIPLKKDLPLSQSKKSNLLAQTSEHIKDAVTYQGRSFSIAPISIYSPVAKK